MNITGVILAGGKSSRYGKPKMFERFRGKPLYKVAVDAFEKNALPVVIATNETLLPHFSDENVTFITEQTPHEGPLYALTHVMEQIESDWYFVVAADMPFIDAAFIATLCRQITANCDAVIPTSNDNWQPLAALYHRRALEQAKQALFDNKRSMRALLHQVRVSFVEMNDTTTFLNINAVEDWPQGDKGDNE